MPATSADMTRSSCASIWLTIVPDGEAVLLTYQIEIASPLPAFSAAPRADPGGDDGDRPLVTI